MTRGASPVVAQILGELSVGNAGIGESQIKPAMFLGDWGIYQATQFHKNMADVVYLGWERGDWKKYRPKKRGGQCLGGLGGACVSESVCAEVPPNGSARLPRIDVHTPAPVSNHACVKSCLPCFWVTGESIRLRSFTKTWQTSFIRRLS